MCAPKGFVAGGAACGIKEGGAPDLAIVATEDRSRGAGRRRVHHQPSRARRRCRSAASTSTNGHAAAVVLSSGQRERGDGGAGPHRRPPHDPAHRRRARRRGRRRARLLDRADRLLHCRWRRSSRASRRCARTSTAPTAAADAILTTDTVRKEAVAEVLGTAGLVGGMAKGAAMLEPGDGHDARGRHHRRADRPDHARARRCSPRPPTRSTACSSTAR